MISTSGHLIPKFPEVRFHRTRIFIKMNIIDLTRKGGANMKIKKVKTNGGLNVIHRC